MPGSSFERNDPLRMAKEVNGLFGTRGFTRHDALTASHRRVLAMSRVCRHAVHVLNHFPERTQPEVWNHPFPYDERLAAEIYSRIGEKLLRGKIMTLRAERLRLRKDKSALELQLWAVLSSSGGQASEVPDTGFHRYGFSWQETLEMIDPALEMIMSLATQGAA